MAFFKANLSTSFSHPYFFFNSLFAVIITVCFSNGFFTIFRISLFCMQVSGYKQNGSNQMFLQSVFFAYYWDISCICMLLTFAVTAFLYISINKVYHNFLFLSALTHRLKPVGLRQPYFKLGVKIIICHFINQFYAIFFCTILLYGFNICKASC